MDNGYAPDPIKSGEKSTAPSLSGIDSKDTGCSKDRLLQALNKASAVIQKSTFSDEEFVKTFRSQVTELGMNAAILLLDPAETSLIVHMTTHPAMQIRNFERLTGLQLKGFKIPLSALAFYPHISKNRKPFFINVNTSIITRSLPEGAAQYKEILIETFGSSPTIFAPLLSHTKLIGVITISGNDLSEDDIPPMEAFANHISIALENLKLFTTIKENETKLKKQADDMGLINALNEALNHKKPLYKILALLVNETKRIFGSYNASIWFCDKNKEELVLQDTGLTPPVKQGIENLIGNNFHSVRIRLSEDSIYGKILSGMQPHLSNDEKDIMKLMSEFVANIRLRGKYTKLALSEFVPQLFKIINVLSAIIVPLGTEDDPIGLFEITRSEPFRGEDLARFEAICRQVTMVIKRKQDEDQLTKLSNAVEQSPAIVIIANPEGGIEYTNPTFTEVTGYTFTEVAGRKPDILHTEQAGREEYERIQAAVSSGGEWKGEIRSRKKNGDFFWEASTMSPIKNSEGEIIHYLSVSMDITDQKRMEEEIFKIRNLESLGLLAGGIAHDFNNILTGILGNINLAKTLDSGTNDEFREILHEAEKAAILAKNLTQQLLTFAKGGAPIRQTSSLVSLIKETVAFALRGSRIEWKFDYPDDLFQVDIDRTQIAQVINNIIINAEQSMRGSGTISIVAKNLHKSRNPAIPLQADTYVKISIADTGAGIDESIISKIFNPYFTTKEKGTGLGLAIAYSIVKRHGGLITVDSKLHEGTTFTIFIPESTKKTKREKSARKIKSATSGKILLVDDEELVRKIGIKLLSHLGYDAECACNGDEAVQMLGTAIAAHKPFRAVILDLSLSGGKGGNEILESLRKIDPDIKAIASSGYSKEGIMSRYGDFGFDGIVMKPYRMDELGDTLGSVLSEE